MYLTYTEYTKFGGQLRETLFNRLSFRADSEIDNATQGRLKDKSEIPESVKRCAFELVLYFAKNIPDGSAKAISSFGNDGYSVSYSETKSAEQQIYDIIYTYLADTGLMYCGVG